MIRTNFYCITPFRILNRYVFTALLFFLLLNGGKLSAQSFMEKIKPEHPRLIITPGQIDSILLWQNEDELLRDLLEIVRFYADSALNAPLIAYKFDGPGDPRLKDERRHAMFRVLNCGLMFQLTGDTVYAARVRDEIKSAAAFPDWGPSHYLNIGELSLLCGIGYDWVYDYLTEQDKAEIIPGLMKNGIREGVKAYNGNHQDGWWVTAENNWNQVCNGGLALLALALAEEIPDTAEFIVNSAINSIPNAMESYIPEGAWHEGPTYWAYGTTYNGMLLSALRTAFGDLQGLEQDPGYEPLGKSGLFHIHTAGPTGLYFNYGDSKKTLYYSPVLFWMASEFNEPAYAWFERLTCRKDLPRMKTYDLMNDDTLDRFLALLVAWYSRAGQNITYDDFSLDKVILSGETAVGAMHSSWDDDALYIGFKGGKTNISHAHMDIGSFVLDADGERWAMDLGTGDNSLPGYYDRNGKRWDYYRCNNFSHNTLTLMNRLQDKNGFSEITQFYSDENYAFAQIDMSPSYPIAGKTVRSFEMKDRETIVITDVIEQTFEFMPIRWQMVTDAEVELGQSEAILKKNGKAMKVKINEPGDAVFSILSTDPGDDRQRSNEGTRMLAIEYFVTNPVRTTMAVEFIPGDSLFSVAVNADLFSSQTELKVFPNPFHDEVTMELPFQTNGDTDFKIYDFAGKLVYSDKINVAGQVLRLKWNGKDNYGNPVPSGIYFFKINSGENSIPGKVIKK